MEPLNGPGMMPTLCVLAARASESKSREAVHQRAKKMKHHYREVSRLEY